MGAITATVIAAFFLPPLNLAVLAFAGVLIARRRPKLGRAIIASSFALLLVLSTPLVANNLLTLLEQNANAPDTEYQKANAIVVLAGGRNYEIAEFGGDTVDKYTLERVYLASHIHRKTRLPMLITGGRPDYNDTAEADLMQSALTALSTPAKWVEPNAINTAQNASYSREILAKEKINTILLVTHGWHMPRARQAFERAGFTVIPVGAGRHEQRVSTIIPFIPTAEGFHRSGVFMHEVVGMAWYWLRDAGTSGEPANMRAQ
jgi:uncharacterized SAM-binding protein YcdF (DUF218 family)